MTRNNAITDPSKSPLAEDRFLGPEKQQKKIALRLYHEVRDLPIISPHGHVDPGLFVNPDYDFGTPVDLLITPDHYILRMLYSRGIPLEALGVLPRDDAVSSRNSPESPSHRQIWQTFAENFHMFRGTPTGLWLREELATIFGIHEKLTRDNAQVIYDRISARLKEPDFTPRRLFERFNIEVLCTTDAATDALSRHQVIQQSGWQGRILPTFRPDDVVNLAAPGWRQHIETLSAVSGIDVGNYASFIAALEQRRSFFKEMGAVATDHDVQTPLTEELSSPEADAIFQRALAGRATREDARRFTAHMIMEMARMSIEDGLVMQLHVGVYRNHNALVYRRYGPDKGSDVPVRTEFTRNLAQLLQKYGNDPRFTLIIFTLDESTYARELAPLAGYYPVLKLGPPWWFHDSLNGMHRYFDQVMETAGLYNTVGFNDDTRAFPSIPVRHDLWRRASANWLAGLLIRGVIEMEDAVEMVQEMAYGLARRSYKL